MAATFPELEPLRTPLAGLAARGRSERVALDGAYGSAAALLLGLLAREAPLVALVADAAAAEELEDDLAQLASFVEPLAFGAADGVHDASVEERESLSERLLELRRLARLGAGEVALVPAGLLLDAAPSPDDLERRAVRFATGDALAVERFRVLAEQAGYLRVPLVAAPAEYSVRGDILDLFPLGEREPLRIELFDERIESIRSFDPATQRSIRPRDAFELPLLRADQIVEESDRSTPFEHHLPPQALRVFVEPSRLKDRVHERAATVAAPQDRLRAALHFLDASPGVDLRALPGAAAAAVTLRALSVAGVGGSFEHLDAALERLGRNVKKAYLFAGSAGERRRLAKLLARAAVAPAITLETGRLRAGFQLPELGVAFLNHVELLGRPAPPRLRLKRPVLPAKAVQNLLELSAGDHVVHQTHGIARYQGLTRMKRDEGEEDFLVLEFAEGTLFYLPASKIDLVARYVGAGAAPPRLDKIGGRSWSRKKARVAEALEEMALELLEVQATREERTLRHHPADDPLIADFEASFPYQDTPDQARSMTEIHADLDGPRPMDRLLCGDVGFGKTELAVRAAFRTVVGGRQVAVLVPTTLLAEQHLEVFAERLVAYPVKVAALSRFRRRQEQGAIVERLKAGSIDIVIGTHRLLSRDVGFKDLGLVVVDEEQRFGVRAKEALKRLKRSVDVLALSATPIPRTLHMALVGLRDISSLATPPRGRRPVRTEVRAFDQEFLRKAVLAELARGGQVFYVHNRIRALDRIAHLLSRLVPTARVAVAHGQLSERELERAIKLFAERKVDILLSTAIIESGLDLPHANTMIVDRPELFGLADLHQLRGRVGRADVQAFCYLLVGGGVLPQVAEKRLKAVEELAHLGAGYDIAIKDLEIRGAGNLLGAAQHGHIAAVGYDLYVRLLKKAVLAARGRRPAEEPGETDVDLGVTAFLPAAYVPDPGQRMELLRRLSQPDGPKLAEMLAEIRDRFGRPPDEAVALLALLALRRAAAAQGIRRLLYPGGDHVLVEVRDPRAFRRAAPFPPAERIDLSPTLSHVRLAAADRRPRRVLDLLAVRLLGGAESG